MSLLHLINWLYVASGFVVGCLVGLTGVGGGSLMTPILVLLFGVHPIVAVGTDLLYACFTKAAGSLVHGVQRTIEWRVVFRLALGSVPAALITVFLLQYFHVRNHDTDQIITKVLGVALIITALGLIFRGALLRAFAERTPAIDSALTRNLTILTGAMLGILVSISSVGAGAIGMTVLILLYPGLPISRLVGADIAHAVPLTLVAGAGHWMFGNIDMSILGSLLIGSLPGIILGSALAPRTPERLLRLLLATVLGLVAWKLLT